jgi:MoaA/NifB/PqqE/SkfB family radical SAM enzyme
MCYICGSEDHTELKKRELTAEQWIKLGRQARDAGCLFLTLTGGEIFIRKDFWQIYEALSNMGFLITLFTNGSLLNDDMISRLSKHPPIEISISLYGSSSETYGNINGHPEAYEKVKENIHKLVNAGVNIHLKTPIIKYTSSEYIQMREFARTFNKPLDIVNYISPRREGMVPIPWQTGSLL